MKKEVLFFLVGLILIASIDSFIPKDDTDSPDKRSGMSLYIDNLNGCQYLSKFFGGLTPRLDNQGKQICHRNSINY